MHGKIAPVFRSHLYPILENAYQFYSLPSIYEVYSMPQFNSEERDYFFTFNNTELEASKQFHSRRNRIYFLLMLGYFKIKPV